MTAGGGLDIKISRHISFRPIAVDYYLTRLRNLPVGGAEDHQNNLRYSAGVTFLFGGEKPTPAQQAPPAPRTKTCPDGRVVNADAACPKLDITLGVNATSQEVCQGDTTPVIANPAERSERIELRMVCQRTAGRPGSDFQFWHCRPPAGHVQSRVDSQWQQFQPGVGGDDDHG